MGMFNVGRVHEQQLLFTHFGSPLFFASPKKYYVGLYHLVKNYFKVQYILWKY